MHRRRLLALASLAALAPLASLACRGEPEVLPPDVDTTLVVGCDLDNAPFASLDELGEPVGHDIEMMRLLAARLGRRLEWRRLAFADLLPALEAGAIDAVCATLGVTPERAQRVAFTRPYFETGLAVVVAAREGAPRSFADLAGKPVGASPGTTSERAVRQLLPQALCVPSEKAGATLPERLLSGDLAATVLDGPAADLLVARSAGALTRLRLPLAPESYAIAVAKGRPQLLEALDLALADLERTGQLAELDQRYGVTQTR
jgi:polar amino acid transport system substrate-binding protein